MLVKAILILLLAAACTAAVILWRKYEDEKAAKYDEISRGVNLENELQAALRRAENAEYWQKIGEQVAAKYINATWKLQKALSAMVCPTNNHIWDERGVCRKCGVRSSDIALERMNEK